MLVLAGAMALSALWIRMLLRLLNMLGRDLRRSAYFAS